MASWQSCALQWYINLLWLRFTCTLCTHRDVGTRSIVLLTTRGQSTVLTPSCSPYPLYAPQCIDTASVDRPALDFLVQQEKTGTSVVLQSVPPSKFLYPLMPLQQSQSGFPHCALRRVVRSQVIQARFTPCRPRIF